MGLYAQEEQFWRDRQAVLQQLSTAAGPSSPRPHTAAHRALIPPASSTGQELQLCSPIKRSSLPAQQALLDVAAARHELDQQAAALHEQKARLAERRVLQTRQVADVLAAEAGAVGARLDCVAAEVEAELQQLAALGGDLQAALLCGHGIGECEQLQACASRHLAQLRQRGLLGNGAGKPQLHAPHQHLDAGSKAVTALEGQVAQLEQRVAQLAEAHEASPPAMSAPVVRGSPGLAVMQGDEDGDGALGLALPPGPTALRKLQAAVGLASPAPQAGSAGRDCSASAETAPAPALSSASLRAKYQAALAGMQERHAQELSALRAEHQRVLACQGEAHQAALAACREEVLRPAHTAELCLLRDENRTLKEKLQSLSAEFESRLPLAAFHARCSAEQAHQQQLAQLRQQGGGMLAECQALRERLAGLEAEHSRRVEEALVAQRGKLEDGALRAEQAHSQAVAALHAHYSALLGEREREHAQLLQELRALRSCCTSLAPSRADTRADERVMGAGGSRQQGWQGFTAGAGGREPQPRATPALLAGGLQGPGHGTWGGHGQLLEPDDDC